MSTRNLGNLVVRLSMEMDRYKAGWNEAASVTEQAGARVERATKDATEAMEREIAAQKTLAESAGAVGFAIGAAAVAAAGSMVVMVKGAIDNADAISKLSAKTGIATETLSAYQHAANLSNVSNEALGVSLRTLSKHIADNGEVLARMGVAVKDGNGNLRNLDAVMADVADKFAGYKDGAGKAALAQELFGRSGIDMINMLNNGSAGLEAMRAEAQELGLVISQETGAAAEEFNDNLTRLKAISTGYSQHLAAQLLPLLKGLTEDLRGNVKGAGEMNDGFSAVTETLRALIVIGGNVSFVLKGVGTEIGGLVAQAAAVGRGDFAGAAAIGKAMKDDAQNARAAFDLWEKGVMSAGAAVKKLKEDMPKGDAPGKPDKPERDSRAASDPYAAMIKSATERVALLQLEGEATEKVTEAEKLRTKYQADLAAGYIKYNAAADQSYLRQLDEMEAQEKANRTKADAIKLSEQQAKEAAKTLETQQKQAERAEADLEKQQAYNATLGLSKVAVAELNAAKLEDLATSKERQAAYEDEIDSSGRLGDAYRREADALRQRAQATRDGAAKEAGIEAAKETSKAWKETGDFIERTLLDSVQAGFRHGESFGKAFFKSLEATAKTTVLRFGVQMVGQGITGMLGGSAGGGTSSLGSLSNLSSMNTLYQGGTGYMNGGVYGAANNLGFGSQFAAGGLFGQGGAASGAMGVGGGAGGASGVAELTGTAASNGAAGSGMAAAAPFAVILAPLFAAYADGFFSGEQRGGGQYGYSLDGISVTNARRGTQQAANGVGATFLEGPDGGDLAAEATKLVINSTVAGINDALRSFGSQATLTGFQAAYETSQQGKGGVFAGGRLSTGAAFGESGQGSNEPGSNGADPARSLYEMWGAQIGAFGTTGLDTNGSPEQLATDAAQSYIEAIQASAGLIPRIVKEQYQRDLSGNTSGYAFGATMGGGDGAETVTDATTTQFRRVYDDAMKQSARELGLLPKRILDLVIDVDPEALSAEATAALSTKIQALVNNVNGFHAIVDTLPVKELRSASFDAAAALVELSGGLEKFAANVSSYVDNFYSDEEKRRAIASNISATLAGAGIDVSADTLLTTTREQFRAVAEGQDVVTESGQRAKAALMSVAPAFASITKEAVSAGEQLRNTIDTQRDTITSQRAYARELREFRDGLLLGDKSPLNVSDRQREAERQFNATLAGAQAGDATARGALTGASDNYLSASLASARSKSEYDAIFARVSTALTITAAGADSQATVAEQQLGVLQSQLDALGAIDINVESLAAAFDAYTSTQTVLDAAKASAKAAAQAAADATVAVFGRVNSAQAPTPAPDAPVSGSGATWDFGNVPKFASGGMHLGGARIVGDGGGPELEVTGPARIFSASQTRDILRGDSGAGNQELLAEMRLLRQEIEQLKGAANSTAISARRTSDVLETAMQDGDYLRTKAVA